MILGPAYAHPYTLRYSALIKLRVGEARGYNLPAIPLYGYYYLSRSSSCDRAEIAEQIEAETEGLA